LRSTRGNMTKTAKLLGIARSTLYEKCKAHNL
jgi:transcriptional regulator of acetoin/glycerol metabolism